MKVWICLELDYEETDIVEVYGEEYQADIWLHQKEEEKKKNYKPKSSGPESRKDWDYYPRWYKIEEREVK